MWLKSSTWQKDEGMANTGCIAFPLPFFPFFPILVKSDRRGLYVTSGNYSIFGLLRGWLLPHLACFQRPFVFLPG